MIDLWEVVDENTDISGVWIRWIDNKLCLEYSCECCGSKINKVLNKTIYYSFAEKAVLYYIRKLFPDALSNYKKDWLCGCELDIFIPKINVGIEIDGATYHKKKVKDVYKDIICRDNGVQLIRIRDTKLDDVKSISIKCNLKNDDSLTKAVVECFKVINVTDIEVDVKRDRKIIERFIADGIVNGLPSNIYDKKYICKGCLYELGIGNIPMWFLDEGWVE